MFDDYSTMNGGRGMRISSEATPIGYFGVEVRCKDGMYWCVKSGVSRATYSDGAPREWQESFVIERPSRVLLLRKEKEGDS